MGDPALLLDVQLGEQHFLPPTWARVESERRLLLSGIGVRLLDMLLRAGDLGEHGLALALRLRRSAREQLGFGDCDCGFGLLDQRARARRSPIRVERPP